MNRSHPHPHHYHLSQGIGRSAESVRRGDYQKTMATASLFHLWGACESQREDAHPLTFGSIFSNAPYKEWEGLFTLFSKSEVCPHPKLGNDKSAHHRPALPKPAPPSPKPRLRCVPRLPHVRWPPPHAVPTQTLHPRLLPSPQDVSSLSHWPPTKRHGELIEKVWISELHASGFKFLPCLLVVNWYWVTHLSSICLHFILCRTRVIVSTT